MSPRGIHFCKAIGVAFMVSVWVTVMLNYAIAAGCKRRCYGHADTPLQFPEHLFISSTLIRSPTKYTGLAGFSVTSVLGVLMGLGRYLQIRSLTEVIEGESVRKRVLQLNRRSMKYLVASMISLVLLSAFPPSEDPSPETLVHYLSALMVFLLFVIFVATQVCRIERTFAMMEPIVDLDRNNEAQVPLLDPDPDTSEAHAFESYRFKKGFLCVLTVVGLGFLGCTEAWTETEEGTVLHDVTGVIAPLCEVATVLAGSCFIALSDFTTIESVYSHLQQQQPQV